MTPRAKNPKTARDKAKAAFLSTNSNRVDLMLIAGRLRKLAAKRASHISGATLLNAAIAADLIDRLSDRWPNIVTIAFPELEEFISAVVESLNREEVR